MSYYTSSMQNTSGFDNKGYIPPISGGYQPNNVYPGQQQPGIHPSQQMGTYPGQQMATYPSQHMATYPSQHMATYPSQQMATYPSQQMATYPSQQMGTYPSQQMTTYPSQQTNAYSTQSTGAYPPQQPGYNSQQYSQSVPQKAVGFSSQPQQQQLHLVQGQWGPSQAKQFEGEMPNEYVNENAASEPPQPSAPPCIDTILPGYEGVASNESLAGPPPAYTETIEDTRIDSTNFPSITAEEAKDALIDYVSQKCCYGKGAAEDMSIKDLKSSSAFHYSLETFTEGRSTKWHHKPYSGGMVDGPEMGSAPGPWDIACVCTQTFQNEVKKLEVPHTAFVKSCHSCHGRGFERCWKCLGRGRVICSTCDGTGKTLELRDEQECSVNCTFCNGSGKKKCGKCSGKGCIRCRVCKGFGQIKQYIQLTVTFTNRLDDHIIERTAMPDHLMRGATGDMILEQVAVRVGPVVGFMENEINQQSHNIVNKHATSWPSERILQQRQKLRAIPVYECDFKYNDKKGQFWVYGKQRAVYTDDYPHTCCCCSCSIL